MIFIKLEETVKSVISAYYNIVIWGAPFALINYVILGWLMGQMKIFGALCIQIGGNALNIILDILLVYYFHFEIEGVAFATLFSQMLSTFIAGCLIKKYEKFEKIKIKEIFNKTSIKNIFMVNSDLMLRTACLLVQTNILTAMSTGFGTNVVLANAILLNIQSIISYMLDGIANTSSVFAGKAVGEKNKKLMKIT